MLYHSSRVSSQVTGTYGCIFFLYKKTLSSPLPPSLESDKREEREIKLDAKVLLEPILQIV